MKRRLDPAPLFIVQNLMDSPSRGDLLAELVHVVAFWWCHVTPYRVSAFELRKIITLAYELRFRRSLYPRVGKIKIYNFHLDSVG